MENPTHPAHGWLFRRKKVDCVLQILNLVENVALKDTKRIFMEINVRSRSLDPPIKTL